MSREADNTTIAVLVSSEGLGQVVLWTSSSYDSLQYLKILFIIFFNFSTGGEARTPDTRFWRPVLYQLSYSRKNQFPTLRLRTDKLYFRFVLVEEFSNLTRTYCTATFADSETQTYVQSYWVDQFNLDFYVITRHYHFNAF